MPTWTDPQARRVLTIAGCALIAFAIFLFVRMSDSEAETWHAVIAALIALGGVFLICLAKFGSRKAVQAGASAI